MRDEKLRNLVAGCCAGCVSAVITCPLDMLKIRLQNTPGSAVQVFSAMWQEGFSGMYKAVGPTVFAYVPTWAVYFSVYEGTRRHLRLNGRDSVVANVVSALCGGLCSSVFTNPLWVVRSLLSNPARIITQSNTGLYNYRSTIDGLYTMITREGYKSIYKGLLPSILGVTHVVIQFPLYEHLKSLTSTLDNTVTDGQVSSLGILASSTLSKIIASSLTYPHEILRTRMHTQVILSADSKSTNIYSGISQSARLIWTNEGWKGFYRGFSANLIRTVPASALTLLTFELLSKSLDSIA